MKRTLSHAVLAFAIAAVPSCGSGDGREASSGTGADPATDVLQRAPLTDEALAAARLEVERFCGDCHGTPQPDEFPRRAWASQAERCFEFHRELGRTDLEKADFAQVVKYYRQLAPEAADFYLRLKPARSVLVDPAPLVRSTTPDANVSTDHAVANVFWDPEYGDDGGRILYCDMTRGEVCAIDPKRLDAAPVVLATIKAPTHIEPVDLDRDGLRDYVVADIGEARGLDVLEGKVLWLRNTGEPDAYETIIIDTGFARTCDARPGDFDADGDDDLIIAEFGYFETGRITLLENVSLEPLEFRAHVIDDRHGAINVIPIDIDEDGDLDFIALVSQEHETIDAFVNRGDGSFDRHDLYRADTPSYASSGIGLADLDRDGDMDILYANGDSFDGPIPKPHHSVQWLRNDGGLSFSHHHVGYMPGVHRAVPLDVDNDGDTDLAAVSLLPNFFLDQLDDGDARYDSVACFINRGDETFERRSLETGNFAHPSCAAGDFDGDGDVDLAVGNVGIASRVGEIPLVDIWERR